jgi:hypothetical protein
MEERFRREHLRPLACRNLYQNREIIGLHFQDTTGDIVSLAPTFGKIDRQFSVSEECDIGRVTREDPHHTIPGWGHDTGGRSPEYLLLRRHESDGESRSHDASVSHFLGRLYHFLDPPPHVERLLGQVVELPFGHPLERLDGVFQPHVPTRGTGEGLGNVERL